MAAVSSAQPSRVASPDVIDVDALEDEPIVYTGYRGRPVSLAVAGPSSGPTSSTQNVQDEEILFTGYRRRSPRRASRPTGSAQAGPSGGSSSSRNNVIIVDCDEEVPLSRSSRHSHRNRSRLFSPPPPAARRGHTPGVPPLPPHLASQSSLPRRRRNADVPPPIRPISHPLPFEASMATSGSRARAAPRHDSLAPAPAPRSHHQPSMGLGGALIALNRQNAIEEANRANRERERAPRGFNLPTFTEILRRMTGFGEPEGGVAPSEDTGGGWRTRLWPFNWNHPVLDADNDFVSSLADDDALFGLPERQHRARRTFDLDQFGPGAAGLGAAKVVHWRREYTHPWKLAPGFTHDFAPSEDPSTASGTASPVIHLDDDGAGPSGSASTSSSATAVETTLVCARCLDPLVLAPLDDISSQSEELKMRRVWALRCGHMLDGKCVAELMIPPKALAPSVSTEPSEERLVAHGKGKGKAREDGDVPSAAAFGDEAPAALAAPMSDRKGKRKAVDPPESEASPKRPALSPAAEPEPNSMRSRLRSHARAGADVSPSSSGAPGGPAHVTAAEPEPYSSPSRRGRRQPGTSAAASAAGQGQSQSRARVKGKARAKVERKPPIEAEHEWKCPVAGCGCVHYSVRVEGVWKTDETRGAIALFV
ncbi:hypothetical protein PYCCODRAFT_1474647 [Trametes coccinea BRFM310]|uniref:Uncharacterized protein n=1 Tax=Trametes coccinea (strain BRFM310) TaxID=1353009 RepID=A0A1Y2J140_TRAC3|nr:hypothetical protein PYCCODRAFT_1474647 [Trametes coccinea BRFM310]